MFPERAGQAVGGPERARAPPVDLRAAQGDARAALEGLREHAEGETADLAAALRAAARREEMLRGTVSAQLQVRTIDHSEATDWDTSATWVRFAYKD